MISNIINFFNINAAGLTILLTLVAGAYKFWQYVNVKKSDALQRDYENFHNLIDKLVVDRKQEDGRPFIDIQIASVYELKNYSRYYKVSEVILKRMKDRLKNKPEQNDLINEIDKVSNYISKTWVIRLFTKI